jgi:transposase-like protein
MNEPIKSKLPSPEERLELILLGLGRRVPVRDLCRQAGVSRELFYRWLRSVRLAGLRALEAKLPGPKPVPPEKAQSMAHKLTKRVEHLEKEVRGLRKERDHWRLLAETAKRIIRRNAWGPATAPVCKKNGKRGRKPAGYTAMNG